MPFSSKVTVFNRRLIRERYVALGVRRKTLFNIDKKMAAAPLSRQLSTLSKERMKTLRELDGRVRELEDALHSIEAYALSSDPAERMKAKTELRQLVGHYDKLEFSEIDAVATADLESGRASAKHYRKSLHARIQAMRDHTDELYAALKDEEPVVNKRKDESRQKKLDEELLRRAREECREDEERKARDRAAYAKALRRVRKHKTDQRAGQVKDILLSKPLTPEISQSLTTNDDYDDLNLMKDILSMSSAP